jgi:hypothetical protein
MTPLDDGLRAAILTLLAERGAGKSICPSDAARAVAAEWRPLMPQVRAVAGAMAAAGEVIVTQRGQAVDPATARGAIRIALA